MIKFLLDSGDPEEYKTISALAKDHGQELWGSTTNPSLIAKKLAGTKVTFKDAFFTLQKEIVEEILFLVPGAVSAEVYSTKETSAEDMIEQGREIATWHPRVVVKLPTTLEGFKARTQLRKEKITINNTLVFSQQQSFAISLHEKLMKQAYGAPTSGWPCFISPFIGRLDDRGENGATFLKNATDAMHKYFSADNTWMLAASIRNPGHIKASIDSRCELMTVPAKIYHEWFALSEEQKLTDQSDESLQSLPLWQPSSELLGISSLDDFFKVIENGSLDITHPLTDAGIEKFVSDWQTIVL
jgi:transaldolase